MINFIIAARRKREDTQDRYFYEWGIIHVALMITTPKVMQIFRRYVQHYSVSGVTSDRLLFPLSDMEWDNMAEHIIDDLDGFAACTKVEDYVARMQPHKFGDGNFVLLLGTPQLCFEQPGFERGTGGVKLIHFLKRKTGVSNEAFNAAWAERHNALLQRQNAADSLLQRYVQNRKVEIPTGNFSGSLFAAGDTEGFAGTEEFWFRNMDDLHRLADDPAWRDSLMSSYAAFTDTDQNFSMVTTERIIYDFTKGGASSPQAAVLNPNSLEAAICAQGFSGWNIPKPI